MQVEIEPVDFDEVFRAALKADADDFGSALIGLMPDEQLLRLIRFSLMRDREATTKMLLQAILEAMPEPQPEPELETETQQ